MTIRQKLFLILGVSQICLILALVGTFGILIEAVKNEPQNKRAFDLSKSFDKELRNREELLKSVMTEIIANSEINQILKSGMEDRQYILNNVNKFKRYIADYNLNIFELGSESGKVHFRFHRPEDYGDDKSNQKIIQEALNGKISSTLEVGHSGLGLRVTAPIQKGTLLLGQVVNKEFLLSIIGNKDVKIALLNGNEPIVFSDPSIRDYVHKNFNKESLQDGERIKFEDRFYYVLILPYDSRGLSVLKLDFLVMIDETELKTATDYFWKIFYLIAIAIFSCVFFLSYFFSKNIIFAIKNLNKAMQDLNDNEIHKIDTKRKDEIGEMGKVFLSMKDEIFKYQEHLESLVDQKTKELQNSLEEIKRLKELQDGDYFLTSLLIKPLSKGSLETRNVKIETLVRQKKTFLFRNKQAEIGGDLCVAETIVLQKKSFSVFLNADAMGKSIQGAGGVLVLGTVFKAILTRTLESPHESSKSPERWLKDCFNELQKIFISFDGSMLISAIIGLIDEENGTMYYINAEHPWAVLFRDGKAEFIKKEETLFKIGLSGLNQKIRVSIFELKNDDVLILGSDGRDDLLKKDASGTMMNEDEEEFLRRVMEANADLEKIEAGLEKFGEITDDLTLMKISFKNLDQPLKENTNFLQEKNYRSAKALIRNGNLEEAVKLYEYILENDYKNLDVQRILVRLYLKRKQYKTATLICKEYIDKRPGDSKYLYYLSYGYKKIGEYESAIEFGERYSIREPEDIRNLLNLIEVYLLTLHFSRAEYLLSIVERLDPENETLAKLKLFRHKQSKRQLLNV
jgi:serine phosphatase RsbU (regulator of sigma subunit)